MSDKNGQALVEDAEVSSGGEIPVDQVRTIRDQLNRHREEAEFGRENFEGAAGDVAHGKYFISNKAIELLDELIENQ